MDSNNTAIDDDQRLRDLQRDYVDILEDKDSFFTNSIQDLIDNDKPRYIVSINDIRAKNVVRARGLMSNFSEEMTAFQRALKEVVGSIDPKFAKSRIDFHIGLEGSFGALHLNPRTLKSSHLNHMVCLEGIITKCSTVNPKVVKSVHYCPKTTKTFDRNYTDIVSLEAFPSSAAYPTQDEEGNPLETEYGLSLYKDHQTITMQELPEKAPIGQLPRSVDIICENDMVDLCKPGDRVQIVGSYRCLPSVRGGFTSGIFRSVLLANNIIPLKKSEDILHSEDDLDKIKKIAKSEKNIFATLSRSLAPSIYGHEYVKKALLCQLLGGVEKILPNGTRLRGDINVLLIGDPSVAKSQLLRYVLSTANRAVTTTGRGSSGVGLTAAVTTDQETGERRLEAGAMVLADQGIVCIDEFDKMTDMDRTAIHEVMEQGKVTISKAGIHARLNARCSVLAAANPVHGRYDIYKTPMENIGLQDSLLSRFDLLFIMLDTIDTEGDKRISDHVVNIHHYRSPKESDGMVTEIAGGIEDYDTRRAEASKEQTSVWDKHNTIFKSGSSKEKFLSADFVKKYVAYAKTLTPILTDKACNLLEEEYASIRTRMMEGGTEKARTQPITARAFETLIRLATAHAKARLSTKIDKKDAQVAIDLVEFACFKEVAERKKKRRRDEKDSDEEDEDIEMEDESEEDQEDIVAPSPKRSRQNAEASASSKEAIPKEMLDTFMSTLSEMFKVKGSMTLPFETVVNQMMEKNVCTKEEVDSCIEHMSNKNYVMLSDGVLYWI